MVREYALKSNLPFYTIRFKTKTFAKKNGLSVQMAARELRYDWFEEIRQENGYDKIAIAHNLNDNIETVLINLIRGTGITGMTGIRPLSNFIIRPLLFVSRQDIMKYSKKHHVNYREDSSNADTKYIRNKIRHLILPLMKEINPSIETTLNDTTERFSGIYEIVSDYIAELRDNVSENKQNFITFYISQLKPYLHNKAILFELFKPYGLANSQLNDLLKIIDGNTGGHIFTPTHRIIKNRKELIVTDENNGNNSVTYTLKNIREIAEVPGIESARYVDVTASFEISPDPFMACIDSRKLVFPLVIRPWKAGDYFYPLGMKHKKKLSDYFINSKYSLIDKENKLILESEGMIVWIIGDRIDNRFRITNSTKKALIIKSTKKALNIVPVR